MDKNSHNFSLEVIKSVDQFYSESFAHLLMYIGWAGFALSNSAVAGFATLGLAIDNAISSEDDNDRSIAQS